MSSFVTPTELAPSTLNQLRNDGFIKLSGLFTPTAVEGFRLLLADQLRRSGDRGKDEVVKHGGGGEFAGYSNNVDLRGDVVKGVRESPELHRLCAQIDDGR